MTISRSRLVDATVGRWYHCISRCVRRAHFMGDEAAPGRKDWIENRLKELDQIFAVSVGGFSLMDEQKTNKKRQAQQFRDSQNLIRQLSLHQKLSTDVRWAAHEALR